MTATLYDTVQLIRELQPLEREGWIIGACGSTLRDGVGSDVDLVLIREPDTAADAGRIPGRLLELGLKDVVPHRRDDGTPSGFGFVGVWRGLPVDIGVVT